MDTLELLLEATGLGEPSDRPRRPGRFPCGCEPLEARPLLSASVTAVAAGSAAAGVGGAIGGPVGTTAPLGLAGGSVNSPQLTSSVGNLLADATLITTTLSQSPGSLSLASGLLAFPITPLLSPTVTSNETPLDNGTPFTGTVWITEVPQPPGIFHFGTTLSPVFSDLYLQTVNPQGGPPSFTHFGEDIEGSLSGVAIEEPVGVGPVGPSMTIEIKPVQPAPVESQQLFGPPPQLQQDETTTQNDSRTPPGGISEVERLLIPLPRALRRLVAPYIRRARPIFGGGTIAPTVPVQPPSAPVGLLPPEIEAPPPPAGGLPGAPALSRQRVRDRKALRGRKAPPPPARCARGRGAPPWLRRRARGPGAAPAVRPARPTPRAVPAARPESQKPGGVPAAQPPAVRPQGGSPAGTEKTEGKSGPTSSWHGLRQHAESFTIELIDAAIPDIVSGS